ncbi:MAG TPA: sterol desaturase family protein [Polyangiaceae bacterium]|jgi:lathosterol oxidase
MGTGPFAEWALFVAASVGVTVVTFWGVGGLVHHAFYVRRRASAAEWKLQPGRWLGPRMTRHAFFLGSANIVLGSIIGGTFAWRVARGGFSLLYFDAGRYGLAYLPVSAVLLYFAIDAGLYYSHRALHGRWLFRHIHRWHHRYTAPVIFTTTAVHPLEFLTFELFLVLPAFVIPAHWAVYVLVVAYTYFIGMVDHSGVRVRWKLPLHADNRFHDDHHVYFHCNYGHHTALFDRLHATVRRTDRRYDEETFGGRGAPVAAVAPVPPAAHAEQR